MTAELRAAMWIAAPPQQVWQILADLPAYPEWNPFIVDAAGALLEGERLRVRIAPEGGRATTFRSVVRCVVPGQELRWRGSLLLPGLFDGEHAFRLQPLGRGTHVVQRERFTGALVPLLLPGMRERVQAGFEAMNAALRARAESRSATTAETRSATDGAELPAASEPA
jgi:hypothetical protein